MLIRLLMISTVGLAPGIAETLLHYRVFDTDAAIVSSGSIPGVDESEDGVVFAGTMSLSEDIPTEGVPAGAGNRSLLFDGSSGVNLPGTQQLLNSVLETSGGFTYEAWINFSGGGNINSVIDYAGTEKLVREAAGQGAAYRNNSAAPLYPLGLAGLGEWQYAAAVFEPTGPESGGSITGDFTFYFNGNEPTEVIEGVTITNFGDSLTRTISVGAHPLGFGGDFFNGLIYEPRVSLGALQADELLYTELSQIGPVITALERSDEGNLVTWTSQPGETYAVEYSLDLESWELAGSTGADSDSSGFSHQFSPDFEELREAQVLFYRVTRQD